MNDSLNLIQKTVTLIKYYNFDLAHYHLPEIITKWLKKYQQEWLPLAVVEAIYQGKLKLVSVEKILNLWHKKGKSCPHFNSEFEKLVTFNLDFSSLRANDHKKIFGLEDQTTLGQSINLEQTDNSRNGQDQRKKIIDNMTIIDGDYLTNFKPLEDYSNCFHKLKSLVEQAKGK